MSDNLENERNIGKEGFNQLDLKQKSIQFF